MRSAKEQGDGGWSRRRCAGSLEVIRQEVKRSCAALAVGAGSETRPYHYEARPQLPSIRLNAHTPPR